MNKAELIRAIAKRAGIPDINAKLFFEVLLKRLSEELQPGQAADIPGIGYLQLRKGKLLIKDEVKGETSSEEFLNLIVYYRKADKPDSENLIFNIPEIDSHPQDSIEQSFSLSIGKPVVPLEGVKETDYFTPLTGKELRDLVSSRVEILLSEINIVRDYKKGSEVLLITPEKFSKDEFEIKWDDLTGSDIDDEPIAKPDKKKELLKTSDKIEWEFGSELNKQIEEEAILDTEKEENSLLTSKDKKTNKTRVDWNFGITQEEIYKTEEIPVTNEKSAEDTSKKIKPLEEKSPTEEQPGYQKIDTLYERLKSRKSVDTDEFNLTWNFDTTEQIETTEKEIIEEPFKEKHFPGKPIGKETIETQKITEEKPELTEVKETKSITDEVIENRLTEKPSTLEEEITKDDEVVITKARPSITKEKIQREKTSEKYTAAQRRGTYRRTGTYSKKGSSLPFFIGILVIITVGVVLFSFFKDINLDFLNLTKKKVENVNKSLFAGTNVIERNYDIPVSFKSDKKIIPAVIKQKTRPKTRRSKKRSIYKKPSKKITQVQKNVPVVPLQPGRIKELRESMKDVVKATKNNELNLPDKKEKTDKVTNEQFTFENLPAPIDTAKLHANIYRVGNTYTVQVSSWKSSATAEREASKLKKKGYDSFVAKALIPGKGLWYRVRVRNFKTQREAEDFLLLYQ